MAEWGQAEGDIETVSVTKIYLDQSLGGCNEGVLLSICNEWYLLSWVALCLIQPPLEFWVCRDDPFFKQSLPVIPDGECYCVFFPNLTFNIG